MDDEKKIAARRDFLKMAAAGALGSLLLPGCSNSDAAPIPSPRSVSVIGIIDIAQALADNSLENNIYWLDNNSSVGSQFQGTNHLKTALKRGDFIQWVVSGLQVETVVDIANLSGPAAEMATPVLTQIMPGVSFWTGKIPPTASGLFQYTVALQVENRLMTMSSLLALDVQ